MAQAGFTPILIYASGTATNIPAAGDLISGSSGAELAINYADGKLYYKDGSGSVKLLSIGYGSSSVTPTNGGVQYGTGTALALTAAGSSGQILRSNGAAAPTWADLSTLGVNTISFGTTGLTPNSATAGAVTVAGTLATTNGGTGLTSFTANGVFYASSTSVVGQSANLTFDGTTLVASNLTDSSLTSGRVVYATTSGNLTDSANLLYSGTDLTVYGITVGRGAGAVSTNTAVGASALAANTTGSENTATGAGALAANTSGTQNAAFGRYALPNNTTASGNSAFGYGSMLANSTGASNSAFGYGALYNNTTASNNTAVGYQAGYSNTTGASVVAVGRVALYSNTTGAQNTAVGESAMYGNSTGNYNAAFGYQALNANTTASYNTVVGYQAGYANTTGETNAYFGATTGIAATGSSNSFFGVGAGAAVTSGAKNTIIGRYNGNQGGLDIRTASNYIVLSDGDGNPFVHMTNGASLALQGAGSYGGTGITFPATQNASSNANTLDDYEEGTWTPAIRGSGTAGTYELATAEGSYVKIGKQVTLSCRVIFAAAITGGGTGYLQITGAPSFNNAAVACGAVTQSGLDLTANYTWLTAAFTSASGTNILYLDENGDNVNSNDFPISGVSANDSIRFSITYIATA